MPHKTPAFVIALGLALAALPAAAAQVKVIALSAPAVSRVLPAFVAPTLALSPTLPLLQSPLVSPAALPAAPQAVPAPPQAMASLSGLFDRLAAPPAAGPEPGAAGTLDEFYSGPQPSPAAETVVATEAGFLEDIQRLAFDFFWENTDPKTGLTKDRAANFESTDAHRAASIAASGFALTALGIAEQRGWITRRQAYERALGTLRSFRDVLPHNHGWFYHFMDVKTGRPMPHSEVSSIDTALLLAGALSIGEHFKGTEVEALAQDLYRRVDFPWMMTDGGAKPQERTLSMGWTPERGFLKDRWDHYSESMILLILGLGSPTHPLPPEVWEKVKRPRASYGGHESLASGPLFTRQYSHAWIDFRGLHDGHADYFEDSVAATLANRRFTIDRMNEYATYSPDRWGLTASDGPDGYRAYSAPPGRAEHDGTIAPTAAGGSIVFTPELSIRALRGFKDAFGGKLWGRYGFSDAFNTDPRWKERFNAPGMWRSPDVLGIDQGAILVMIENLRSGLVWRGMMRSPFVRRGLERAGFSKKKEGAQSP
ncbi:MAG: glucoamylase family protein [Elusimicrobiota bacterium]